MKKAFVGIGALVLIALVLVGAAAVAKADLAPGFYDPPYSPPYVPPQQTYSVQTMQGFVMNEDSLETEPVVLVRLNYGSRETTYLIIGESFHKLHEVDSQWVENGEVVKYSIEGMDEKLTLYSRDGFYSSASGVLGDRMIVFEPQYYAYPMAGAERQTDGVAIPPLPEDSTD